MIFQKNWALNFIGNWWSLCYVWRSLVFQIFGNSHLVFKNAVGGSGSRNYTPVSLLYVVGKIFAKFVKNRLVDTVKNCIFFSDFHFECTFSWFMLAFQLQNIGYLYLIELLGALTWLVLLELYNMIYQMLVTVFGILVLLTNKYLMGFLIRLFFFRFFLSKNSFLWFCVESLF